jgi:hypothetical protein
MSAEDLSGRPEAERHSAVRAIVERAQSEPSFRGLLIYFPKRVADEYGLTEEEYRAIDAGDVSSLDMDEEAKAKAAIVFDLHDLHSGE